MNSPFINFTEQGVMDHPYVTKEDFSDEVLFEELESDQFSEEITYNEANENEEWEEYNYEDETKRSYANHTQKPTNIFVTLTGEKQGQIKGKILQKGMEGTIAVYQLRHEITSPRDAASGQATGKRQHKPLVITKEIDRASVKLLQALITNENLKKVIINFYQPAAIGAKGGGGKEINYYRITLTNAAITNISQEFPAFLSPAGMKCPSLEKVEFIYQKIEWEYLTNSPGMASDEWKVAHELEFHEAVEEAVGYEDETINEWDQQELDEETDEYNDETINEWDQEELDEETEEYKDEAINELDQEELNDETINELDLQEFDEVTDRLHHFEEPLMEIEEHVGSGFPNIIERYGPKGKNYLSILTALIANGATDENELTNRILWLRHPKLNNRKLTKNDSPALKREWIKIRNEIVRPLLKKTKESRDNYYKGIVEEPKKQADLHRAIVLLSSLKNYKDSVFVEVINGEPVIFEFEDGKPKYNLSYPNEKGRFYYKKGDIILLSKAPANNLPSYFVSSKDTDESDENIALLAALLAFLTDGENTNYDTAFRIERIFYAYTNHGGARFHEVVLMPLLKIDDTWIEGFKNITVKALAYRETTDLYDGSLSTRFRQTLQGQKLSELGDFLKIVAKISAEVLSLWGGGVQRIILKKALRWGAKKALGTGIKKVIKYYISRIVRGIPGVLFAGAKAFAKTLLSETLKQIVQKNNLRQFQAVLRSKSFESIMRKASTEMAKAMVDRLFELLIGDKVDLFFRDLLKRAGKTGGMERVKALITGFITEKIISLFTKDFLNELINISSEAYEGYLQNKGDFGTLFSEKFNEKLRKDLIEKSKDWGRDAAVDLISEKVIKIFDK